MTEPNKICKKCKNDTFHIIDDLGKELKGLGRPLFGIIYRCAKCSEDDYFELI